MLETHRLRLEPFTRCDPAAAFPWFRDPEVMRFIPTGPDLSLLETEQRLARYVEHHTVHGFSKWIVRERASGQAIGDAGLIVLEHPQRIDLGFRFARAFWGQGFATEVASAWVRAAFVDFQLDFLTAFAHPPNRASLRVLEKERFPSIGRERIMGMESVVFSLTAAEFQSSAEQGDG